MKNYQSLHHTKWDCKYHVVFIPKRRKEKIFGVLRKHLGDIFHELAKQKESRIEVGHLHLDHVHICISIPPKYAVSNVIGYIKGKSAISIARNFMGRRRNFSGENPIESTFSTVRLRTAKVWSCFSAKTVVTVAFKLCQCAQKRWQRLQGSMKLAEVISGVIFVNGIEEKWIAA